MARSIEVRRDKVTAGMRIVMKSEYYYFIPQAVVVALPPIGVPNVMLTNAAGLNGTSTTNEGRASLNVLVNISVGDGGSLRGLCVGFTSHDWQLSMVSILSLNCLADHPPMTV